MRPAALATRPTGDPLPPRDYQEDILLQAYDFLTQDPSLLITAPTGSGKCHPAGTGILMHDGSARKVEDIRPGDRLMGPDSQPRTVLSTADGRGAIVEIRPVKGDPWRCNDDHVLTLVQSGGSRDGETLDIPVRLYRKMPDEWKRKRLLVRAGGIRFGGDQNQDKPQGPPPGHERSEFVVEDVGEDAYHGFTLDGDGRYLLPDFTVTHNTVILAEIAARALRSNKRAGLLVHREELVEQAEIKIAAQTGRWPGVVWQSRREWDQPFTIIAQDTVSGLEIPRGFRLHILMVDEAHHTVAPGWLRTIERLGPRFLLGFSATPFRQDREPLSPEPFARVIRPITPHELIERDVLCPAVIESPIIHDHNGQVQPVNKASNLENIYLQAVRHAIARGRSKILLYVSQTREHTPLEIIRKTTATLQQNGVTAGAIHQYMSRPKRRAAFSLFKNTAGSSALINYQTLTEGTDLPHVDCVIIGRHTESESTIIQMIGRGLRKHPLKTDCLVLDYSGRPDMDNIIHYWRLDEPREEGGSSPRNRNQRMSKIEMEELAAQFPMEISPMDTERARYPWFRPFETRPLLALPLWSGRGEERYVTVEPSRERDGGWKVSRITLHTQGVAPVFRQQGIAPDTREAVRMVRSALGENAPMLERTAGWRLKDASSAQLAQWKKLYQGEDHGSLELTAGEASDGIAMRRFQNRVDPKLL